MTNHARQRRLAGLENRSKNNAMPYIIFSLFFVESNGQHGGRRCVFNYAKENGGREWHREQDETPEEFEKRVEDTLDKERNGHATLVVFDSDEENIARTSDQR
jgi:hypothetical protein